MAMQKHDESDAALLEKVLMTGDLKQLTPQQRIDYHAAVCKSAGLPPLTSGLQYITLNGKLVLYATRATADHLATLNAVSVDSLDVTQGAGFIMATATMSKDGRRNVDIGYVATSAKPETEAYGNAVKKAVTQARRRCILGLCGLGMLDETETGPDTIPTAHVVDVDPATGVIEEPRGNAGALRAANNQQAAPTFGERVQMCVTPADFTTLLREVYDRVEAGERKDTMLDRITDAAQFAGMEVNIGELTVTRVADDDDAPDANEIPVEQMALA